MEIKSWVKYLIYSVLIFSFALIGQNIIYHAISKSQATLRYCKSTDFLIKIVFYGGIGVLFGLENLVREIKKKGDWKINFPKLALLGIPLLYFSFYNFIYFSNIPFISEHMNYNWLIFNKNYTSYLPIFQAMLGYVVVTSFYKVKRV